MKKFRVFLNPPATPADVSVAFIDYAVPEEIELGALLAAASHHGGIVHPSSFVPWASIRCVVAIDEANQPTFENVVPFGPKQ